MESFGLLNRTKYLILFALCTLGVCLMAHGQVSKEERLALLDFHESTDGKQWIRTWDLGRPVTEWHGITVTDGHVTALELFMNRLAGSVPESIGDLEHLVTLNLAFNSLNGELPQSLAALPKLRILKLEMNRIRGPLPDNIEELGSLEELSAFNNFLSGGDPRRYRKSRKAKNTQPLQQQSQRGDPEYFRKP